MDTMLTNPAHAHRTIAPACDSFADILAASSVIRQDNGTVIQLNCGSTLRLENVQLAQLAPGVAAARTG